MYLSLSALSGEVVPLHVVDVICVMPCTGLKCLFSGDAPQGSWNSINGLNCYGGVVLDPIRITATYC